MTAIRRFSSLALAAAIGLSLPTIALAQGAPAGEPAAAATDAAPAKKEKHPGEKLYLRKTCIACHGKGGVLAIQDYPNVAGQQEKYMLRQIADILEGKRVGSPDATGNPRAEGMKGALVTPTGERRITDDEIKEIVSWLASLAPASPKAPETPIDAARLAQGAEDYKKGKCQTCHGVDGKKPTSPLYPFIAGQKASYITTQIKDMRDGLRNNGSSKLMLPFIKKLDDETIGRIADYLSQVDRNQP